MLLCTSPGLMHFVLVEARYILLHGVVELLNMTRSPNISEIIPIRMVSWKLICFPTTDRFTILLLQPLMQMVYFGYHHTSECAVTMVRTGLVIMITTAGWQ